MFAAADLFPAALQSVKVATALNWQMVCGCVAASNPMSGTFDPIRYNNTYAAEFAGVKQHALKFLPDFKVSIDLRAATERHAKHGLVAGGRTLRICRAWPPDFKHGMHLCSEFGSLAGDGLFVHQHSGSSRGFIGI